VHPGLELLIAIYFLGVNLRNTFEAQTPVWLRVGAAFGAICSALWVALVVGGGQ
jgi:hypothetical protein